MPIPALPTPMETAFVNAKPKPFMPAGNPIVCPWYTNRAWINPPFYQVWELTIPIPANAPFIVVPYNIELGNDIVFNVVASPDPYNAYEIGDSPVQSVRIDKIINAVNANPNTSDLVYALRRGETVVGDTGSYTPTYDANGITLFFLTRRTDKPLSQVRAVNAIMPFNAQSGILHALITPTEARKDYQTYFRCYVEQGAHGSNDFAPTPFYIAPPLDYDLAEVSNPSTTLVYKSNPWRAFWADVANAAKPFFAEEVPLVGSDPVRYIGQALKTVRIKQGERVNGVFSPETDYAEIRILNAALDKERGSFYFEKYCLGEPTPNPKTVRNYAVQPYVLERYFDHPNVKFLNEASCYDLPSERREYWLYVYVPRSGEATPITVDDIKLEYELHFADGTTTVLPLIDLQLNTTQCELYPAEDQILQIPIRAFAPLIFNQNNLEHVCVRLRRKTLVADNLVTCCDDGTFDVGLPCTFAVAEQIGFGTLTMAVVDAATIGKAPAPSPLNVLQMTGGGVGAGINTLAAGIECTVNLPAAGKWRFECWVNVDEFVTGAIYAMLFRITSNPNVTSIDGFNAYGDNVYEAGTWVRIWTDFTTNAATSFSELVVEYGNLDGIYDLQEGRGFAVDSFRVVSLDDTEYEVFTDDFCLRPLESGDCERELFIFQNKYGVFEAFTMRSVIARKLRRETTEFTQNIATDVNKRERITLAANTVDSYTAMTDLLTQYDRDFFESVLRSPSVYWYTNVNAFCSACEDDPIIENWTPILFNTTDLELWNADELGRLTLEFRLSQTANVLTTTANL